METNIELNVTESKLLNLIALFSDYQQDITGLSAKELQRATGLSSSALDRLLILLCENGLVTCVLGRRKYRDGRNGVVPVYRVSEKGVQYAATADAAES